MATIIPGLDGKAGMKEAEIKGILGHIPERGVMLEVGTLHGVTVGYWARKRPYCAFVSVDPFIAGKATGPGDPAKWLKNHGKHQYLFVGKSRDIATLVGRPYFSFAFIDGSHSYEDCISDLENVSPLMLPGAKIACHDFLKPKNPDGTLTPAGERLKGVKKAVDEFVEKSEWRILGTTCSTAVLVREKK